MLMGRGDDAEDDGRTRREPARAVIGGTLVLLAVAGLAALAGGSPGPASLHPRPVVGRRLGGGGHRRSARPRPRGLRGGRGAPGGGRRGRTGVHRGLGADGGHRHRPAVRWLVTAARGDRAADTLADGDEPTDPFGRALAEGRQPSMAAVATTEAEVPAAGTNRWTDADLHGDDAMVDTADEPTGAAAAPRRRHPTRQG